MLNTKFPIVETVQKSDSTVYRVDLDKYRIAEVQDFADRRVIRGGRFRAVLTADKSQPGLFDADLTDKILARINRPARQTRKAVTDGECRAAHKAVHSAVGQAVAYMEWRRTGTAPDLLCNRIKPSPCSWENDWCDAAGEIRVRYIDGEEIPHWDHVPTVAEFEVLDDGAEPAVTWLEPGYLAGLLRERQALVAAEQARDDKHRAYWRQRGTEAYETFVRALDTQDREGRIRMDSPLARIIRNDPAGIPALLAEHQRRKAWPKLYYVSVASTPAGHKATAKVWQLSDAADMADEPYCYIHRARLVTEFTMTGRDAVNQASIAAAAHAANDAGCPNFHIIRDCDHLQAIMDDLRAQPVAAISTPAPTPVTDIENDLSASGDTVTVGPDADDTAPVPAIIAPSHGQPLADVSDAGPATRAGSARLGAGHGRRARRQPHGAVYGTGRRMPDPGLCREITTGPGPVAATGGTGWPFAACPLGSPVPIGGDRTCRAGSHGAAGCLDHPPVRLMRNCSGKLLHCRASHRPGRSDHVAFSLRQLAIFPAGRWRQKRHAQAIQFGSEQHMPIQRKHHLQHAGMKVGMGLIPAVQISDIYNPPDGAKRHFDFRFYSGCHQHPTCGGINQGLLTLAVLEGHLARIIPVLPPYPAFHDDGFPLRLSRQGRQPFPLRRLQLQRRAPMPVAQRDGARPPPTLPLHWPKHGAGVGVGLWRHCPTIARRCPHGIPLMRRQHADRGMHGHGIDVIGAGGAVRCVQGKQRVGPALHAPCAWPYTLRAIGPSQQFPHGAALPTGVFRPPPFALTGSDGQSQFQPGAQPGRLFPLCSGIGGLWR